MVRCVRCENFLHKFNYTVKVFKNDNIIKFLVQHPMKIIFTAHIVENVENTLPSLKVLLLVVRWRTKRHFDCDEIVLESSRPFEKRLSNYRFLNDFVSK